MIGAFLSVLGGNVPIGKTADYFLHHWSRESCLGNLIRREEDIALLRRLRVRVELSDAETLLVPNLLGEIKEFERTDTPESIFFGKINIRSEDNPAFSIHDPESRSRDVALIRLRTFPAELLQTCKPEELGSLLAESTRVFCVQVLGNMGLWHGLSSIQESFDGYWKELSKSDQYDIGIYQDLFIEDCHQILKKHFEHLPDKIRKALSHIAELREKKALKKQVRLSQNPNDQKEIAEYERKIEEVRSAIRQALENDDDSVFKVRENILASIRRIINEQDQYSIESIPFELFQNADDAYFELKYFPKERWKKGSDCFFEISLEESRLILLHAGRNVNQYPPETNEGRFFDRYRFDKDIFGMLDLNTSGKYVDETSDRKEQVTGKFGLGFKSVFLLSDRPRILSGQLRFRIEGGIYPVYMDQSEVKGLRDSVSNSFKNELEKSRTLIELPFRKDGLQEDAKKNALVDFKMFIHPLLVFAKKIRSCTINGVPVAWDSSRPVEGIGQCFFGRMDDYPDSLSKGRNVLEFRNEYGSFLFAVNSAGFAEFDRRIPTFWTTTPSKECCGVGFLVNSFDFQIDVGRSWLIKGAKNTEIARKMGRALAEQLVQLYKRCGTDWDALKKELALSKKTEPYDFWKSLWRLLSVNFDPLRSQREQRNAADLLLTMFWESDDSAAAAIFTNERYKTVPSDLEIGAFRQLVSPGMLKYSLKNVVNEHEFIFRGIHSGNGSKRGKLSRRMSDSCYAPCVPKSILFKRSESSIFYGMNSTRSVTRYSRIPPRNWGDFSKMTKFGICCTRPERRER